MTTITAHATEIQVGDYVAYESDGARKRIEARKVLRDVGCVHVWDVARVVTFPSMYPVVIAR